MSSRHLTLPCDDLDAGASFFRDILALPVHQRDPLRVEVELGPITATLTARCDPAASQPEPGPAVIVELRVPDVPDAVHELHRRGATVLVEPVITDWGTESAFVEGPDGLIVEIYQPRPSTPAPWLTRDRPD